MWAIPMDIAPRYAGSASGLMNTGSALAAIVSPLIAGYVIDRTGVWELPFIGSIALLLLGAMLAFLMKPDQEIESPVSPGSRGRLTQRRFVARDPILTLRDSSVACGNHGRLSGCHRIVGLIIDPEAAFGHQLTKALRRLELPLERARIEDALGNRQWRPAGSPCERSAAHRPIFGQPRVEPRAPALPAAARWRRRPGGRRRAARYSR